MFDKFDDIHEQANELAPVAQRQLEDRLGITGEVRLVGSAMIVILIITLVLTEVHDAVAIDEGPFSEIVTDLETTGVAAMSLLVVGLVVVAASAIMSFFGGGFGGGR